MENLGLDSLPRPTSAQTRCGVFSLLLIAHSTDLLLALQELTIDYKYDRIDDEAHPCYCGSDNCRGELDARQEPSSGKGGVGAAERALRRLQRTLEALADATGQLEASSVLELLKLMRSTFQVSLFRRDF